jgi:hypothetical protein
MATTNNAIVISGGLSCSALTSPAIGIRQGTVSLAYTDGDAAADSYVNVAVTATALHTAFTLGASEYGFVAVANPGPLAVNVLVDATPDVAIGTIPPGTAASPVVMVFPVATTVVLVATVASGTQLVGVSAIKAVANV